MFEIGSSLREARERRELELADIERDTRIRTKYLQALEDDRFDRLPAPAYAKAFLRTYADYLDLEAQRFVDEYETRFAPTEEPQAAPLVRIQRPGHLRRRLLLALPVALVVGLVVWGFSRGGGQHHRPGAAAGASPPVPHARVRTVTHPRATRSANPTARIALAATRGPCWLTVRLRSQTGRLVFERTLEPGQQVRFSGRRLWIRLGAPWNLDATLNGKHVPLPAAIGNVIVTPQGLLSG